MDRPLERGDLPTSVVALGESPYGAVSTPLGRALHGRRPASIDGVYPLAEEARPHAGTLREVPSLASHRN